MSTASRPTALRPQTVRGVPLAELVRSVAHSSVARSSDAQLATVLVSGVSIDSRTVVAGDLYAALPGRTHHGARFVAEAVRAGAVAVLTDPDGAALAGPVAVPVVLVDDPRRDLAPVAARIYGDPAQRLTMFGVTGTNGKTTTSFLLDAALRAAGVRTGVIGTLGYLLDGQQLVANRTTVTTPESSELQALLAVLAEDGADACVMEVSSHALALHRADAITFDVAAFTNFGRDHLDFHGDEESYFEAKARLFTPEHTRSAVVNVDDPRGAVLLQRLAVAGLPTVTVSLADRSSDYWVATTDLGADGVTTVRLHTPDGEVEFGLGLPGDYNVRNAVTALAMIELADRLGPAVLPSAADGSGATGDAAGTVDLVRAAQGLAAARVPGRMERIDLGPGAPAVFVDFAHTPQAVAAALSAVAGRRRIVVLGAGGDRDPDKRGPIGAAAAEAADVVLVTDDNPRSEDPQAIRRAVLRGAREVKKARALATEVLDAGDRRTAIRRGLEAAGPDDALVILGKGHERGQEVAGVVLPFRDTEVVRAEWAALARRGAPG